MDNIVDGLTKGIAAQIYALKQMVPSMKAFAPVMWLDDSHSKRVRIDVRVEIVELEAK